MKVKVGKEDMLATGFAEMETSSREVPSTEQKGIPLCYWIPVEGSSWKVQSPLELGIEYLEW